MLSMVFTVFCFEAVLVFLLILVVSKSDFLCRAPGLDWVMAFLTWLPWLVSFIRAGWPGLFGCILAQIGFLYAFFYVHGKWRNQKEPTLQTTHDRIVGRRKNQLGLFATLPALPVFLLVRYAEIFLYPLLIWTMKFPKYDHGEWVSVSRHKFSGLVGADLVWCLYCDWMTGLYSLGGEMLRNLESFWCPIRFYPDKKCENCQVDFPDIKEWVSAKGTMKELTELVEHKYPTGSKTPRAWFGHPGRKH